MAVHVTGFGCGGIAIGECISHKVCDATSVASLLKAWSQKAMGEGSEVASSSPLNMEASLLFPPKGIEIGFNDMIHERRILQQRDSCNLFIPTFSPLHEVDQEMKVELHDLVEVVRKTIKMVDGDFLNMLQQYGQEVFETLESNLQKMCLVTENGVPCYTFSSCLRLDLYESNFGWGKPTWVCTIGVPIRNVIILMPTSSRVGEIEAWGTLNELHMPQFESSPLLLQFASFGP
ncbi:BAHD acyltransferase At5g47980-like [Neltuma alba]|uniref:BAHD acyltransferase At5g47980-like n=1 Tax=Neltuma alba TaxID=207710 RepID=UPI0010A4CF39|nr:BAHD acyltransferase At5g47980-like [Prosopis alba]